MFFFFNDTATTEIYTLSLHDALPICRRKFILIISNPRRAALLKKIKSFMLEEMQKLHWKYLPKKSEIPEYLIKTVNQNFDFRSEEHTSELQSQSNLVCRLLLEKKKRR